VFFPGISVGSFLTSRPGDHFAPSVRGDNIVSGIDREPHTPKLLRPTCRMFALPEGRVRGGATAGGRPFNEASAIVGESR